MISVYATLTAGPDNEFRWVGRTYLTYIGKSNVSFVIPSEHILAMNNGAYLSLSALDFKRVLLALSPELA